MFEKVNKSHPDKLADRIAGALVDLAYQKEDNPKVALEVMLGHTECYIIGESSVEFSYEEIRDIVNRIVSVSCPLSIHHNIVKQDPHLAENQSHERIRAGDNGVFRGCVTTQEQKILTTIVKKIYDIYPYDGKYILDLNRNQLIICQSMIPERDYYKIKNLINKVVVGQVTSSNLDVIINPLGYWTGGIDVDTGCTNRKLGSDMGNSVTGGGIHGKDLSKADVSINIYMNRLAAVRQEPIECVCAIGDETISIGGVRLYFEDIVESAKRYIESIGGFESFAEYGLIRP